MIILKIDEIFFWMKEKTNEQSTQMIFIHQIYRKASSPNEKMR